MIPEKKINKFETIIGYKFKNKNLLINVDFPALVLPTRAIFKIL